MGRFELILKDRKTMLREFFKDITRDIRGKRYLLTILLNWYSVFSITEPLFLVLH